MDIIVTTPKTQSAEAAEEAADAKKYGGDTRYFRRFPVSQAPNIKSGDHVYYVEDGYIRGRATIEDVINSESGFTCDTTGNDFGPGIYAFMRADSWEWIEPIPYPGFQGFRYMIGGRNENGPVKIVGGWLDPKPEAGKVTVAA